MKTLLLCLGMLLAVAANAIELSEAKSRGLVGEANDGYLGYVTTPPSAEVKELVETINRKRQEKFAKTAREFGLETAPVAQRFYQRAVIQSESGHYIQDANDEWVKKP